MGELHTRMTASGNTAADRTGLRTDYLPALRKSLVKPMVDQEKEGIMAVIYEMQVRHCYSKTMRGDLAVCLDYSFAVTDVTFEIGVENLLTR